MVGDDNRTIRRHFEDRSPSVLSTAVGHAIKRAIARAQQPRRGRPRLVCIEMIERRECPVFPTKNGASHRIAAGASGAEDRTVIREYDARLRIPPVNAGEGVQRRESAIEARPKDGPAGTERSVHSHAIERVIRPGG